MWHSSKQVYWCRGVAKICFTFFMWCDLDSILLITPQITEGDLENHPQNFMYKRVTSLERKAGGNPWTHSASFRRASLIKHSSEKTSSIPSSIGNWIGEGAYDGQIVRPNWTANQHREIAFKSHESIWSTCHGGPSKKCSCPPAMHEMQSRRQSYKNSEPHKIEVRKVQAASLWQAQWRCVRFMQYVHVNNLYS